MRRRRKIIKINLKFFLCDTLFFVLKDLTLSSKLYSSSGKQFNAIDVFSSSLKWFKTKIMNELNDKISNNRMVSYDDIKWIITVPAIWKPVAKCFMREAAYQVFKMEESIEIINKLKLCSSSHLRIRDVFVCSLKF